MMERTIKRRRWEEEMRREGWLKYWRLQFHSFSCQLKYGVVTFGPKLNEQNVTSRIEWLIRQRSDSQVASKSDTGRAAVVGEGERQDLLFEAKTETKRHSMFTSNGQMSSKLWTKPFSGTATSKVVVKRKRGKETRKRTTGYPIALFLLVSQWVKGQFLDLVTEILFSLCGREDRE